VSGTAVIRRVDRGFIPAWAANPSEPPLLHSGGTVLPHGESLQRFLNGNLTDDRGQP
jgi:hypothetical protein